MYGVSGYLLCSNNAFEKLPNPNGFGSLFLKGIIATESFKRQWSAEPDEMLGLLCVLAGLILLEKLLEFNQIKSKIFIL